MALLGHSDVETTMRYAHLCPKHLTRKTELIKFQPQKCADLLDFISPNHNPTVDLENAKKAGTF
jgi:hypothetical protein